jgi:hypothetical protein
MEIYPATPITKGAPQKLPLLVCVNVSRSIQEFQKFSLTAIA